jgi:hypothetical protein
MTSKPFDSAVFQEFAKIAKEQGFLTTKIKNEKDVVGNASKPTPVEGHRRYEPTEEYNVTDLDCVIEQAHPEKKKELAKAQGEGGVVENIIEQQKKDIEVATNLPSGALVGVHAELINELVKIANECESKGDFDAAIKIDAAIERISFPFVDSHLRKNAFLAQVVGIAASFLAPMAVDWLLGKVRGKEVDVKVKGKAVSPEEAAALGGARNLSGTKDIDPTAIGGKGRKGVNWGKVGWQTGVALSGLAVLGGLTNLFTSSQEDLKTDVEDLFKTLQSTEAPSARSALAKLQSFASQMRVLNLSTPEGFGAFKKEYEKFKASVWPGIKVDIMKAADIEDVSIFPFSSVNKAKSQMNDIDSDIEDMDKTIAEIEKTGKQIEYAASQDTQETSEETISFSPGASGLQQILSQRGFLNKKWNVETSGTLDANTISAAKELEQYIDSTIKKLNIPTKESAIGLLIINNTLNPAFDASKLNKMLSMLETKLQNQKNQ